MSEIRKRMEQREHDNLSPFAAKSNESSGRAIQEKSCDIRTEFQRDRDRIIHSKAWRRLKDKTQVFLSQNKDHYRNRLTHTLEVSQISRTIARALNLNEDLTEAIAYGHDIGHTPFGHAGERALQQIEPNFNHAQQSVRMLETVERDGRGLNLTHEVLDGIANHSSGGKPKTLEGKIVQISDRIAYLNHDVDDVITHKKLSFGDIPKEVNEVFGNSKAKRIDAMVKAIILNFTDDIAMPNPEKYAFNLLRDFLFNNVYRHENIVDEEKRYENIVLDLYEHYSRDEANLSVFYREIAKQYGTKRAAIDYISGMTDSYARNKHRRLFKK